MPRFQILQPSQDIANNGISRIYRLLASIKDFKGGYGFGPQSFTGNNANVWYNLETLDEMKTWKTKSGYKIIQVLAGRSNVFLLTNGEKNILIDTGPGRLWNKLNNKLNYLNVNQIDYLILTHAHFDHAGNAKRIKERYNALVIIHKDETDSLLKGQSIVPEGTTLITRFLVNFLAKRLALKLEYEPCQYDCPVDTRFSLKEFGFNAYILHTPGHTIGSISVIVDDEIALVGDTMFGVFMFSVFPPYAQDTEQLIYSWGKLLETKCMLFIPSHGTVDSRLLLQKDYDKRVKKITAYKNAYRHQRGLQKCYCSWIAT
jgi:hydroxyacylglutathione hydrolase